MSKNILKIISFTTIFILLCSGVSFSGSSSGFSSGSRSSSGFSGGSRSSSGFSGGSKPSGFSSSSKPTTTPAMSSPTSSQKSGSWFGSSKPTTTPTASSGFSSGQKTIITSPSGIKTPATSDMAKSRETAIKTQNSKNALNDYKKQFAKPEAPIQNTTTVSQRPIIVKNYYRNYKDYRRDRDTYYRGWTPPVYVHHSYSTFGAWDAMFLWAMMDNARERDRWFYNHQNDPGVQAFLKESSRISNENSELKAKMAAMEKDMAELKAKGDKPDEQYMPEDIKDNPAIALAAENAVNEDDDSIGFFGYIWRGIFIIIIIGGIAIIGGGILRKSRYNR